MTFNVFRDIRVYYYAARERLDLAGVVLHHLPYFVCFKFCPLVADLYIYRSMPAGTLSVIVDILETNNDWKKVMAVIPKNPNSEKFEPKYNVEHIRQIEAYAKQLKQNCAEILLNEWGTSGRVRPTLATLKDVVVAAGIYRAGDEIAHMLQEPLPARPSWGPEHEITTSVTNILNQNIQQQSFTAHTNGYIDKNNYKNRCTEPIQSVYYGVESVDTADLPDISALQ